MISALVCPDQKLMFTTYPKTDKANQMLQVEVAITQPGVIQYTVLVQKGCHCTCDIMIIANNRVVEIKTVTFSKLITMSKLALIF